MSFERQAWWRGAEEDWLAMGLTWAPWAIRNFAASSWPWVAAPANGDRWPCLAGLKDSYKPLTRVPALGEAPSDSRRAILEWSPAQLAMYNFNARESCSSGEMMGGEPTAESTRGDLGGVRVFGKQCVGAVGDVGDAGGLQYDVAFWKAGG